MTKQTNTIARSHVTPLRVNNSRPRVTSLISRIRWKMEQGKCVLWCRCVGWQTTTARNGRMHARARQRRGAGLAIISALQDTHIH